MSALGVSKQLYANSGSPSLMAAGRLLRRRRHIHPGVALEKPIGTEPESEHRHGHHWPVFRTRHVIMGEHVPQRDLGVIHVPIRLGPCRQAVYGGMLVGVFS